MGSLSADNQASYSGTSRAQTQSRRWSPAATHNQPSCFHIKSLAACNIYMHTRKFTTTCMHECTYTHEHLHTYTHTRVKPVHSYPSRTDSKLLFQNSGICELPADHVLIMPFTPDPTNDQSIIPDSFLQLSMHMPNTNKHKLTQTCIIYIHSTDTQKRKHIHTHASLRFGASITSAARYGR